VLKEHALRGHSGKVSVGAGSAQIDLFLLDGELIGSGAPDDLDHYVERLRTFGHLSEEATERLQDAGPRTSYGPDPRLAVLHRAVPRRVMDRYLRERFQENICRFIEHRGTPAFQETIAVWTENLQIGMPADRLIQRCQRMLTKARSVATRQYVIPGEGSFASPLADQAREAVKGGPQRVAAVADALDLEPTAALAAVAKLLDNGVLAKAPNSAVPESTEASSSHSVLSSADLDAFRGDADLQRGGGRSGTFVTSSRNLDRVELGDLSGVITQRNESKPQADKSRSFSARSLSEDEVAEKIEIANHVLGSLAQALDQTKGRGAGLRAVTRGLTEDPDMTGPLFRGIEPTVSGRLPQRALILNLRKRPTTEHRRLLQKSLLSLIQWVMDEAADHMDDDAFETLFQSVGNYQKRLGL